MKKPFSLGIFGEATELVLTELSGSEIVKLGLARNSPAFHFEVTTSDGRALVLEQLQDADINMNDIMVRCAEMREEMITQFLDGSGTITYMLRRIVAGRVQVRIVFFHKDVGHLVNANKVWTGDLPELITT